MTAWARRVPDGWLLSVYAQPGARRCEVAGQHGDALKVRVTAPPVEGRANVALEQFLAHALGIPKSAVSVVKGASSRRKTVLVAAANADPGRLLGG